MIQQRRIVSRVDHWTDSLAKDCSQLGLRRITRLRLPERLTKTLNAEGISIADPTSVPNLPYLIECGSPINTNHVFRTRRLSYCRSKLPADSGRPALHLRSKQILLSHNQKGVWIIRSSASERSSHLVGLEQGLPVYCLAWSRT